MYQPLSDLTPRDYQGARLTYDQILQINELLKKIDADYYSFSFVREMRDLANQTFQQAYRSGNQDRMDQVGPELQVLDHVMNVAFSGGYKKSMLAPDPKHLKYLAQIEEESRIEEPEEVVLEEQLPEPMQEEPLFEEHEADSFLQSLPAEVLADIDPISHIPQIAANQHKIRRLIEELRVAMEDDEPPFIIKQIERQIARTHESLTDQLNRQDLARRFFRYNPYW